MGVITNKAKVLLAVNPSSVFLNRERTEQEIRNIADKIGIISKGVGVTDTYFDEVEPDTYNSMRGIIIPKGFSDIQKEGLIFQFNPTELVDKKDTNWEHSPINGFSNVEYIWMQGGVRQIQFTLQFECTAGFNYGMFGLENKGGSDMINTLKDVFPNGTTDYVNRLRSFLYPVQKEDKLVTFLGNNPSPQNRFSHPPVLIFSYGSYYLEGLLTSADVQHTLFDKDLKPRRSNVSIGLDIIEGYAYNIDKRLNSSSND